MSATLVGLVVGALLLAQVVIESRFVRRQAVPADLAISVENCEGANRDASDFRADLTGRQRRQVAWAVWKGRAVADPALAPAAASAAYAAGLTARVSIARPRWVVGLAGVFWGSLAASRLVSGEGWADPIFHTVVLVGSVWLVHEAIVGTIRRADRAQQAQQLNLALMAQRSGPVTPL